MLTSLPQRLEELCRGPGTARQLVMMACCSSLMDAAPALLDDCIHLFNLMLAGNTPDVLCSGLHHAVHKAGDKVRNDQLQEPHSHPATRRCWILFWCAYSAGQSSAMEVDSSTAVFRTPATPLTLCQGMYCGPCSAALVWGAISCPAHRPCTTETVQQSRQLKASASPSDATKGCSKAVH